MKNLGRVNLMSLAISSGMLACSIVSAQTTITLQPDGPEGLDASLGYHDNYNTANNNFGNDIWFKAYCIPGANGGANTNRGLIDFDLSVIPAGASIASAHLYLYAAGYVSSLIPGHFGDNAAFLERVTSAWPESSVSWNSAPSSTQVHQVAVPPSTSSTEDYVLDVKLIVQDMINDPTNSFGFLLRQQVEDPFNSSCLVFHSSDEADQSRHPKLVVTYFDGLTTCDQPGPGDSPDASVGYHFSYTTANTNFGNDIWFKAFCIPGANGGANTTRSLLDFDLSLLLSLFATGYVNNLIPGHFGANSALLQRIVAPWSEMSVTWNTQPVITDVAQVLVHPSSSSVEDYSIDVTSLVQATLADPDNSFGFMLRQVVENPSQQSCLVFWSSDSVDPDKHPKLCLTYLYNGIAGEVEVGERVEQPLVSPNPTDGVFAINVPAGRDAVASVQLIDGLGKVVQVWRTIQLTDGRLTLSLPVTAPGRYTVRVQAGTACWTMPLMVQMR
jgi:hypothetical protein